MQSVKQEACKQCKFTVVLESGAIFPLRYVCSLVGGPNVSGLLYDSVITVKLQFAPAFVESRSAGYCSGVYCRKLCATIYYLV